MEPTLEQEIQKGQLGDVKINEIKELIEAGKAPDFTKDEQATVRFQKRICVPDVDHLREMILKEAMIQFTRCTKMYQDRRERYWWYCMKCDVVAHATL